MDFIDIAKKHGLYVGAARFTQPGYVCLGQYRSGETAIEILGEDGEPQATASVALAPYGARVTGPGYVWLKGWSENEGLPEALVQAGIVRLTGRVHATGFVEALEAEVIGKAREVLACQRGERARAGSDISTAGAVA
jgi:hypothetical protein